MDASVILRFYGDVHWGAAVCDRSKFLRLLSTDTPNSYYISIGDDLNCIPHTDKRFSTMEVYDPFKCGPKSVIENELEDYIETWSKAKIPPERHLGVLEGNHPLRQSHETLDPVRAMCKELGFRYLGEYSAVIPITFRFGRRGSTRSMRILVHHGYGGGRTPGADVTRYISHAAGFDCWDVACYGHTHNLFWQPLAIMDCAERADRISERISILGMSGTFLKTFHNGEGSSYSERAGFRPRIISWNELEVRFESTHEGKVVFLYPGVVPSMRKEKS